MAKLVRVGVFSFALNYAIVTAVIGFIAAILAISVLGPMFSNMPGSISFLGADFGLMTLVIFPIFYGVIGLVVGMVLAVIFNLVASVTGGIEVEFEQ